MTELSEISNASMNALYGTRANVLLVDDNPANLLALRAILEDLGQNLVEVTSGEQALLRLRDDDYAVVLLDVQMHGLDGFETAKLIRSRENSRHTPIIFVTGFDDETTGLEKVILAALTGWGQQEDRRRTAEAGFDHHLATPLELNALDDILAELKQRRPETKSENV